MYFGRKRVEVEQIHEKENKNKIKKVDSKKEMKVSLFGIRFLTLKKRKTFSFIHDIERKKRISELWKLLSEEERDVLLGYFNRFIATYIKNSIKNPLRRSFQISFASIAFGFCLFIVFQSLFGYSALSSLIGLPFMFFAWKNSYHMETARKNNLCVYDLFTWKILDPVSEYVFGEDAVSVAIDDSEKKRCYDKPR